MLGAVDRYPDLFRYVRLMDADIVQPSPVTQRPCFDTFEGGRVYQTRLVTVLSVKAIYRGKTTVSDTFWRPGGV